MPPGEFKYLEYSALSDLDTRICYIDRRINKNHVYDIFGDFSSTDGKSVKMTMLDEIGDNYDWYESRGRVALNMQDKDLTEWLKYHLTNQSAHADEIAVYALSHIYDRHTVIFSKGRPWCTIRATGDSKEVDFVNSCQVHLLYIGKDMYAPLTLRTNIPDYLKDYGQDVSGIWECHPPIDYTAFFKESEYSDYMEVTGSRTGFPSRSHHHGEPSHTVSVPPPDLSMGQPVFPSPVAQLVLENENELEYIKQGNSQNIVSTSPAKDVSNRNFSPPVVNDAPLTMPPLLPSDPQVDTNIAPPPIPPMPPVPPVVGPTKSTDNVEIGQETENSVNVDGSQSDSSGKFYKVDKELFVTVKHLPDSVLHKYISKVSILDDTEDKDTGGMKLRDRPKSKHTEARHPCNVSRPESYASMLASDTDNTDQETKPKRKVKPHPSLEPSSSRQRSQ